jgi:integrase
LGEAFRLAIKGRQLSSMPEIPKLREDNARQGFFSTADFFAVLSKLGDQHVADFVEWFFWTGMRPGEIRSLTWQAFDPETWTLRLHAKDAKIGVGRVIVVEGPLRAIIERRMKARQFGCDLIYHRNGEMIGTFYKRWRQACLAAGVPGKIPYDLRRTAVRNMIRAGVPERVAMSISGHKTRAVFDRYNIVSENDLREAFIKTTTYVQGLAKQQNAASVIPMNQRLALKRVK